jgi:tetratricopeptide (TPR) repeat protein
MLRFTVVFLVVLSGCFLHRLSTPTSALDEAEADASSPRASARTLAMAGFHAWLTQNDPEKARARFAAAVEKDPKDPLALYGEAMLALRASKIEEATRAALDLCERAPRHPLCASASRIIFDAAGTAVSLDTLISTRVPGILAVGAPGDASALLRAALANIHLARREIAQHDAIIKAQGVPTVVTLMGPFSAYHLLDLETPTQPERTGIVSTSLGPFGQLDLRELHFADGRFSLSGEPQSGDVYLLALDLDAQRRGTYVVRTVSGMDHVATLDGTELFTRRTWERPAPTVTSAAVDLDAGRHRLMIRCAKDEAQGHLYVSVSRLDGGPADITFNAALGPPPGKWSSSRHRPKSEAKGLYASAATFTRALEPEVGPALARFIGARDALTRDREGAKAELDELPEGFGGAAVRVLSAQLSMQDRTVPAKVAKGRATRDLEAALEVDKGYVSAILETAQLNLDDGRNLEALEQLSQARAVARPAPAMLLMLEARAQLALGIDAQAALTAREANKTLDGYCEALGLIYDLAVRRDAISEQTEALEQVRPCSNSIGREAEAAKARGHLELAAKLYEELLASDETHLPVATTLANLYVSMRRFADARAVLERTSKLWPRSALLLKELADVYEHDGKSETALAARERALLLDGGDLATRRTVERMRSGKELLDKNAISTEEALKAYAAAPGDEDAPGAYVLDAAAVRVYPDGSMVDRIHIIQKALDQSGIQDLAEVEVPQGAYVLKMRTLKPDGRVLEPESIEGKDTVSLPGVEVGDFVEYEYLLAHGPRGPAQPGFTSASFYFQIARQPNNWSTYVVTAPAGTGMRVDAHNMKAQSPEVRGNEEVFFHEERRVPPYLPEPNGPPSGNEWLPFVSIGAGQTGNDGVLAAYADAFIDQGQITHEVERFARESSRDKTGLEAVRAVHEAVMQRLSGRDNGLQQSAAASVAQDRGSRLMLEYASLKALGFKARLVAVRTFTSDPASYVFPAEALLPYLCLRVELPDSSTEQKFVWLDPVFRFGPFGELPEAASAREAYLLPEPQAKLQKVMTPPSKIPSGKQVKLDLTLTEDGALKGEGTETYVGFGAAQLAEALEAVPPDQREQALQSALSRYFGGAELGKLELDTRRAVGASVTVRYAFTAPRFARAEGKALVFSQATFPALLGRRYLQLGARRTPLFLDSVEENVTTATLTLPRGYTLNGALPEVKVDCHYGKFERHEKVDGRTVAIDERYRIEMARVPPSDYEKFGAFAGEVDLVQGRELLAEKK